jgi:hypothetical protein
MRQNEIFDGVHLHDEQGRSIVTSRWAAVDGITKVSIFCHLYSEKFHIKGYIFRLLSAET